MIQVFCKKRGAGKTKELIELANRNLLTQQGNSVYIDDDDRIGMQLNRKIRFVSTKDFSLNEFQELYGLLCGIISKDYDMENIYIDGLSNIIQKNIRNADNLFFKLEELTERFEVNIYINVDEDDGVPDFIKKYA